MKIGHIESFECVVLHFASAFLTHFSDYLLHKMVLTTNLIECSECIWFTSLNVYIITIVIFQLHIYSMEGGELFQRIQDRQDEGPFTERGNKQN